MTQTTKPAREILREQGCPNFVLMALTDDECEATLAVMDKEAEA